jgi:hypothetical protein
MFYPSSRFLRAGIHHPTDKKTAIEYPLSMVARAGSPITRSVVPHFPHGVIPKKGNHHPVPGGTLFPRIPIGHLSNRTNALLLDLLDEFVEPFGSPVGFAKQANSLQDICGN